MTLQNLGVYEEATGQQEIEPPAGALRRAARWVVRQLFRNLGAPG